MVLSGAAGRLTDLAFLRQHGHGRMLNPDCWKNPQGIPYALDNGAFPAWTNGTAFPEAAFLKLLSKVPRNHPPLFVVCPYKVAAGLESLEFSRAWRSRLSELGWDWLPWYLAVQDGMHSEDVERELATGRWAGVFVGGTMAWKRRTAESWIRMAHAFGLRAHIGRVPSVPDLVWARRIGADTVDSTTFARHDTHHLILAAERQTLLATSS